MQRWLFKVQLYTQLPGARILFYEDFLADRTAFVRTTLRSLGCSTVGNSSKTIFSRGVHRVHLELSNFASNAREIMGAL